MSLVTGTFVDYGTPTAAELPTSDAQKGGVQA